MKSLELHIHYQTVDIVQQIPIHNTLIQRPLLIIVHLHQIEQTIYSCRVAIQYHSWLNVITHNSYILVQLWFDVFELLFLIPLFD